jgi:predicted lactoylglutathione lyase
MSPHISLITLGVADVAHATAFYERLGFIRSKTASQAAISFFKAGPVVLAPFGREALDDDAQAGGIWTGIGGIAPAQNLASEAEVDALIARAETAGARILKPSAKTFWGGYDGYFADPVGHVWDVAFSPFWVLEEGGQVRLPD